MSLRQNVSLVNIDTALSALACATAGDYDPRHKPGEVLAHTLLYTLYGVGTALCSTVGGETGIASPRLAFLETK
jgi:hypothetical protein